MLRGSRTLEMHVRFKSFPYAPRVVPLEMHVRFDAIPHAPRVEYPWNAFSL